MHTTNISFEAMHDNFHYFLQASNRQEFKFGQYISIATLFETLCEGLNNVQIVYRVCINQHSFYVHNSSSVMLSTGTNSFNNGFLGTLNLQDNLVIYVICLYILITHLKIFQSFWSLTLRALTTLK